jgi:hypothetical protein
MKLPSIALLFFLFLLAVVMTLKIRMLPLVRLYLRLTALFVMVKRRADLSVIGRKKVLMENIQHHLLMVRHMLGIIRRCNY